MRRSPTNEVSVTHEEDDGEVQTITVDSFQVQGDLFYAYHRALYVSSSGDLAVALGGSLDFYFNLISSVGITWVGAYSLNVSSMVIWKVAPSHALVFRVYLPFLVYLCRPPWSTITDEVMDSSSARNAFVGHITSVNDFFKIAAEIRYEVSVSEHLLLGFTYELSYYHSPEPLPLDSISNNFAIGVIPNFGGRDRGSEE